MKYVGVSSPAWTIKEPHPTPPFKVAEVIQQKKAMAEALGPGKYELDVTHDGSARVGRGTSFGKENRFKSVPKEPSRNLKLLNELEKRVEKARNASRMNRRSTAALFPKQNHFTRSDRPPLHLTDKLSPGPGVYDPLTTFTAAQAPQISFGYKEETCLVAEGGESSALGPGAYHPELPQSARLGKFAAKPFDAIKTAVPSQKRLPTAGQPESRPFWNSFGQKMFKKLAYFGKSAKECPVATDKDVPGPATINLRETERDRLCGWHPRAFSMAPRAKNDMFSPPKTPTPHAYPINFDSHKSMPTFSFSKAQKSPGANERRRQYGEPTSDMTTELFNRQWRVRGGSLGKSERKLTENNPNPGPGAYETNPLPVTPAMPKFSFGKRVWIKKYTYLQPKIEVSSATYHPKFTLQERSPILGKFPVTSHVPASPTTAAPPIGDVMYDVRKPLEPPGFVFDRANRFGTRPASREEMGPGFYEVKATIPQTQPWMKLDQKAPF